MSRKKEDPTQVFVAEILPRIEPNDPWTPEEVANWFEDTERPRPSRKEIEAMLTAPEVAPAVTLDEGKICRR